MLSSDEVQFTAPSQARTSRPICRGGARQRSFSTTTVPRRQTSTSRKINNQQPVLIKNSTKKKSGSDFDITTTLNDTSPLTQPNDDITVSQSSQDDTQSSLLQNILHE
ncbi:hypothetical protein ACF0H5_019331 [Mactra antiquata]